MRIKKAELENVRKISNLIIQTIDKVNDNKKDYTRKQIKAWKKANSINRIERRIEEKYVFCGFKGECLVGVISFSKKDTGGLYVKFNQIGKGVGKKLLEFVEQYAKKIGVKKLKLTSTPYAYNFYKSQGYKPLKKVNVYLNGVCFREMKMEKKL